MTTSSNLRSKVVPVLGGLALSLTMASSFATSAAADHRIVTMQQVNTNRYADAWEDAGHDFRLVTRDWQNNDTQRWEIDDVSPGVYTIKQVSSGRYVDAHENEANEWNMVTRDWQNNDTQRWTFTAIGAGVYVIQQVSTGRYVDAWEADAYDWRMVTWTAQGNTSQQWRVSTVETLPEIVFPVFPIDPFPVFPIDPLPPAPVVHDTGSFDLPPMDRVNLDNGNIGNSGADVHLQLLGLVNLQFTPVSGAQISYAGGAERGYAGCSAAAYSNASVPLNSVGPGDFICVRTNDGRYSEFRINAIGPIVKIVSASYTTWQ